MKILLFICCLISIFLSPQTGIAEEAKKENPNLWTTSQKFSYVMGKDVITALKKLNTEIDLDAFILGAEDCYHDKTPKISKEEIDAVKKEISRSVKEKQKDMVAEVADRNIREGEAFLKENSKKEGVIVTQSGLQYQIIKEGEGKFPKENDEVVVQYRGFLIDGKEFDSSYRRGGPTKVRVNEVLPGWAEALQKMNAGSKFRIFLPAHLAYGPQYSGTGGIVGPNSTIVFEVELIEIANIPE
ncbi:MAG: FKBP-type peptidyl-prolyl cis-trans isomerase [Pseudomonadota bacterium]